MKERPIKTKVVYNACFGGFSLSEKAVLRYGELILAWAPSQISVQSRYIYENQLTDTRH